MYYYSILLRMACANVAVCIFHLEHQRPLMHICMCADLMGVSVGGKRMKQWQQLCKCILSMRSCHRDVLLIRLPLAMHYFLWYCVDCYVKGRQ